MSNRKRIWLHRVGGLVIAVFAYVGGIASAYWIRDTDVMKTRRMEAEIAAKIAEIPKALERASGTGAYEFGESVSEAISQIPDVERRKVWYRKALDKVFGTEIKHLSLHDQSRSISAFDTLWGGIGSGWIKIEKRKDVLWKDRFASLAWKHRQLDRLKREYAAVKPKTFAKPIPKSAFNRFHGLQRLIEFIESDCEMKTTNYERWCWEKSSTPPEIRAEIKRELETLIGRPVRTLDQIEADRQRKAEEFRRAEEAARSGTNRPPPLILIDGDL